MHLKNDTLELTAQLDFQEIRSEILGWIERDQDLIVSFFSQLVRCKTPSPPGDTRAAIALLKQHLGEHKLAYKELGIEDKMPNLIATTTMSKPGRHLMFNGHVDVLPVDNEAAWQHNPWAGEIHDNRVWGRGTADMKAGVTAILFAYTYLSRLRERLRGRLSISLVSDEETGYGRGTGYLFEQIENEMIADCVLSAEPSGTEAVCFSSKGYMQFSVRVQTRGSISGYHYESESSIHIAANIIVALSELESLEVEVPEDIMILLADPNWCARHDELMGHGAAKALSVVTVNTAVIQGGSSPSLIASDCSFSVSVVLPIGIDPYVVLANAKEIVGRYPEASFNFEGLDSPDTCTPNSEMPVILQQTVEDLGRVSPDMTPAIAMSDCRYWRYRGIPAYWYGPDGSDCGAVNESVSVEDLMHVVKTHSLAAAHYLMLQPENEPLVDVEDKGSPADADPEIKTVPPIRVATLNTEVDGYGDIESAINTLFEKLYISLVVAGVDVTIHGIATYESKNKKIKVCAAFEVDASVVSTDDFEVGELPYIEHAATVVQRGALDRVDASWAALRRWVLKNGYKPKEIYREVYIIGSPNPPSLWATELQQVVMKKK